MKKISKSELHRLHLMSQYEIRLKSVGFKKIAGIDEAGRGPLAGPVVAAGCILPEGMLFENLNDSKQLTPEQRDILFAEITTCPNLIFGIGIVDVNTIDRVNILQATFLAMQKAVLSMPIQPDYILIDGNQKPHFDIPIELLIEGDGLSVSIAAASIIAKVTRDRIMIDLDAKYPEYGFKRHKGYATNEHMEALKAHGPCIIHRRSFDPVKSWGGPVQMDLIQNIQENVEKIRNSETSKGKPEQIPIRKSPPKKDPKEGKNPKNPSERSNYGHVGNAPVSKDVAVGAKRESEKTPERKELGLISDI